MLNPPIGALKRNNVHVSGNANGPALVFAHGFGGSQQTWRFVAPSFEADHTIVLFDHVGAGESDVSTYDRAKYDSLHGYADDIIEIIEALDLSDVVFIGHSVSSMMGVLAANRRPDLISRLVLVGPSARYIDDGDYVGGFSQQDIDDLLDSMDSNYLSWSSSIARTIMGNPERPELGDDLSKSIGAVDPRVAAQFARVTFLSDNRRDLPDVTAPTLILQSEEDAIASLPVGEYVHHHIRGSEFVVMPTRGHIPNLSHPQELIVHLRRYLS